MDAEGYNIIRPFFKRAYKNGQILPITNPIPLIPDNNMYANLKKIHEQILNLSIVNSADGRTDRRRGRQTEGHTPEGIS